MNLRFVAALLCLALPACGYHFLGSEPRLPAEVRSIGVGAIENLTREQGLEKALAFAFEREVHIRRHYRVAEDAQAADAVLSGRIRDLRRHPVAFDENDQAVQYEIALRVDLTLKLRRDGRVLWRVRDLRTTDEYSSNPRVVVTSSSQFQRSTLDPVDLPREDDDGIPDTRQISIMQLADAERKQAIARLLGQTVRDAYDRIVEGF